MPPNGLQRFDYDTDSYLTSAQFDYAFQHNNQYNNQGNNYVDVIYSRYWHWHRHHTDIHLASGLVVAKGG